MTIRYPKLQNFSNVFLTSFNLCIFVSMVLLAFHHRIPWYNIPNIPEIWQYYLIIPTINSIMTGIICVVLYHYFATRKYTTYSFERSNKWALFFTGCIAGTLCIYIALNEIATYLISFLIIYAAYHNLKIFISKLSSLLEPQKNATTSDLADFAAFFINLLITFTVINISLNTIHISLGTDIAFNFDTGIGGIIDAIYFGIITMTTVGYGDIYPHSSAARAIVSIECLTSYLLLGIMIAIIGRGIKFSTKD